MFTIVYDVTLLLNNVIVKETDCDIQETPIHLYYEQLIT